MRRLWVDKFLLGSETLMIADNSGWTIILLGHWNRMIFSPGWVGKELFEAQEVEVMVPLALNDPIIYRKNGVAVHVGVDRVSLSADAPVIASLANAEQIAVSLLTKLSHTPVAAFGINFRFTESPIPNSLLSLFRYSDEAEIAVTGWEVEKKKVSRSLSKDDHELNLQFQLAEDRVTIDANFNFRVESAAVAAEKLGGLSQALHVELLELVSSVYELTEDADGGN